MEKPMSTIEGITLQPQTPGLIQPLTGLMDINLQSNMKQPTPPLMGEDEIDKLINAQIPQAQPQLNTIPLSAPPPPAPEPEAPEIPDLPPENEVTIGFDLDTMNKNLEDITESSKLRIQGLIQKQQTLNSRINLMEKFIILDEKDLAVELAKHEPNYARISNIRKALVNQTELLAQIMDILLKFEDSVHKWYKTLIDIEKDKVSAFQKVKSITKETTTMDGDINHVLGQINNYIHTNPTIAQEAQGLLNMSGYGGKPFNQ